MRIEKSKMTEEERGTYEALVAKYAVEDGVEKAADPSQKPASKAGAVDLEGNQDESEDATDETIMRAEQFLSAEP